MILEKKGKVYNIKNIYIFLFLFIWIMSTYVIIGSGIKNNIRPLIRNIEQRIVLYKTRNLNELETDNFIFRYEDIDSDTLKLIINTTENKYDKLEDIFEYKPDNKLLVVVYKDSNLMMDTTMLKKGDPPMGVYYGNSIHVLDPNQWVGKPEELENRFYNEGPVLHELVHLFTDHAGEGNFPMWFTEGVSLYFEYIVDDYEWGREVIFEEDEYTIDDLNNNFKDLNQYKAYTKSFRLVKAYVEEYGLDNLMDIINSLGKGHSFNEFVHLFEEI